MSRLRTGNKETQSERYHRRKDALECVRCGAGLTPERWGRFIYCIECSAVRKKEQARWRDKNRAKERVRQATRMRTKYQADPIAGARAKREERHGRTAVGLCEECTEDALPDSNFCAKHREKNRAGARERNRRRKGYYDRHPDERPTSDHESTTTREASADLSLPPDESAPV